MLLMYVFSQISLCFLCIYLNLNIIYQYIYIYIYIAQIHIYMKQTFWLNAIIPNTQMVSDLVLLLILPTLFVLYWSIYIDILYCLTIFFYGNLKTSTCWTMWWYRLLFFSPFCWWDSSLSSSSSLVFSCTAVRTKPYSSSPTLSDRLIRHAQQQWL